MEFSFIIFCLLLSGYFSGTETVFLSVNRIRIEGFLHQRRWGANSALKFLEAPSHFVLTTLVGNNLANIAFTSVLTVYLIEHGVASGWITPLALVIILIFGEIIPKSLGRDLADPASLWVAPVLRFFWVLLYPLIQIYGWISSSIITLFGIEPSEVRRYFTRGDLEILIRESARSGVIKPRQESHIQRILQFRSLTAHDVMTPRKEIIALENTRSLADLRQLYLSSGFSKIPIYQNNIDHIIGVAYALDLFDHPENFQSLIRPIAFFPEQKRAWEVFREMRENHQSIAVIVDEWGGTSGLITLEDLVEELFGEIEDEYDPVRLRIQEMGEGKWVVSARMEVKELNRKLGLRIPEGEYETLGGYLLDKLGRIPHEGETFEHAGFRFEVSKTTRTRVRIVTITRISG